MTRRLPSLDALRIFEVAGRQLSFSRAAQELCVTNAAVSHRIKQLESHLGLALFERRNNQLTLTDSGEQYLPRVREALRSLEQATALLGDKENCPLRVAVTPAFGTKWLVPRLYRFMNQYPKIRVELTTGSAEDYRQFDLCINDRQTSAEGVSVEWFLTTDLFPVCSPQLQGQIQSQQDLTRQNLLHERGGGLLAHHPTWQQWLAETGVENVDPTRGPAFSEPLMLIQAAIDGHGVALGQSVLVEYDIAAGRLIKPLSINVPLRISYYLISPHVMDGDANLLLFRQWLRDEAGRSAQKGV